MKYLIIASDLFVYHGGVSDYTDNLSLQLWNNGKLTQVLTPYGINIGRPYEVKKFKFSINRSHSALDRFVFVSKIRTLFYFLKVFWQGLKITRQIRSQNGSAQTILFTEYYTKQFDILIFCARIFKIRYGIVFHGLDIISAANGNFRFFKNNCNSAAFRIFNSEATRELFNSTFKLKQERNIVIYPSLNIEQANCLIDNSSVNVAPRKNKDKIIFTTVSRLVKRKGIDKAILIVGRIAKVYNNIRYYIGGVGEEEIALKELVKHLGLEPFVEFKGSLTVAEKYELLESSDFFLLPNHSHGNSDFEGFGISFLEAALCANIVIGGNHGGAVEAVKNGETGFLFDFENDSAIQDAADKIIECIRNEVILEKMKRNGMEFVKQKFNWNLMIQEFLQFEDAK